MLFQWAAGNFAIFYEPGLLVGVPFCTRCFCLSCLFFPNQQKAANQHILTRRLQQHIILLSLLQPSPDSHINKMK